MTDSEEAINIYLNLVQQTSCQYTLKQAKKVSSFLFCLILNCLTLSYLISFLIVPPYSNVFITVNTYRR